MITGFVLSTTVTVKLHEPMLLAESVAEQVTVVVPLLKDEPEAGLHETLSEPSQLSNAVGALQLEVAVQLVAPAPV